MRLKPLDDKRHEAFARHIVAGKTMIDAFVAAGFEKDTGNASRLHKRPEVQARINALVSRAASKAMIDREYIINGLVEIVEKGLGRQPQTLKKSIVNSEFGVTTIQFEVEQTMPDLSAALQALKLLGTDLGMFKEGKELEVKVIHMISDKPMSADEWANQYVDAENVRRIATDAEQG